jgi:hypothetical protein
VLVLGACGSDDGDDGEDRQDSRPPVATFDGEPITRAEFDEWYESAVKNSRSGGPGKMMAAVPDPPPHRRCLRGYDNRMTEAARYTGIEVPKNECRAGWKSLMGDIMEDLITIRWSEAEARKRGIILSDDEARKVFSEDYLGTELAKHDYGPLKYEDLVENLGEENALARARLAALQLVLQNSGPVTTKYRHRTTCAWEFRVPMCSNGPKPPKAPPGSNPTPPSPNTPPTP